MISSPSYGALGVIGDGRRLAEFIPVGLSSGEIAASHHWPGGLDAPVSREVAEQVLTVEVTDDGTGIPAGIKRSGLRNLASRATELGGEFRGSRRPVRRHLSREPGWSGGYPAADAAGTPSAG